MQDISLSIGTGEDNRCPSKPKRMKRKKGAEVFVRKRGASVLWLMRIRFSALTSICSGLCRGCKACQIETIERMNSNIENLRISESASFPTQLDGLQGSVIFELDTETKWHPHIILDMWRRHLGWLDATVAHLERFVRIEQAKSVQKEIQRNLPGYKNAAQREGGQSLPWNGQGKMGMAGYRLQRTCPHCKIRRIKTEKQ